VPGSRQLVITTGSRIWVPREASCHFARFFERTKSRHVPNSPVVSAHGHQAFPGAQYGRPLSLQQNRLKPASRLASTVACPNCLPQRLRASIESSLAHTDHCYFTQHRALIAWARKGQACHSPRDVEREIKWCFDWPGESRKVQRNSALAARQGNQGVAT